MLIFLRYLDDSTEKTNTKELESGYHYASELSVCTTAEYGWNPKKETGANSLSPSQRTSPDKGSRYSII